jgi:hypothetical protein
MTWSDVLGWIFSVIGFLVPRAWKMPRLIVRRPVSHASEKFLTWWHIEIGIAKSWPWSIDILHNCRVYFVVMDKRFQLTWRTGIEVGETITLQDGDPWHIVPVVVRKDTIGDYFISGSPNRLPYFRVDAFIPRITDTEAILYNRDLKSLPSGEYFPQIQVHSGQDILLGPKMFLNVPTNNELNTRFVFSS